MTLSAPALPLERTPVGVRVLAHAPDLAVGAALAWWATYLTWGTGGREPHVLSVGCALLAAAYVAVRPWRVVGPVPTALVHAVALGAWAVVLTAPTGWAGGDEVAAYTLAAELGLVTWAWATDAVRRYVVLAAVLGAAGAQFAAGWLPWWGAQDPGKLFQGTFYWHNQAGIFLAAGAVLGCAAVAAGRPVALLGWTVTPLCVAGTVYTTSRGSQIALALGVVMLLALLRTRRLQVLVTLALSWGITWLLTGPPFFAERVSPTASTEARSASFVGNGTQRLEDWRRAAKIFEHWPFSGAGFNSFDSAARVATTPRDDVRTAFAHNGYLQAAADGGLVLIVPLVALLAVVSWRVLRGLPADPVRAGGASALLALLLHSGMDFDWGYPSLLALLGPVAALALPLPVRGDRGRWDLPLAALGVGLLVVAVWSGWAGGLDLSTPVS
ncbi:MAG TPA: O-antigen ligase family protein [Nocardioides sp.]|nr:O-antigen ligase family protein [Nocardioides sp.]